MTDLNKERGAFEYWADAKCYYLDKREDGHYEKGSTALAWEIAQYFMAVGRNQVLEKAKAQAVPEWISVKYGLPSYEESVLIKTNKGTVQGYLFQDEEYSEMKGEYMKLDSWQDEFHDDFIEYSDVTHWLPF